MEDGLWSFPEAYCKIECPEVPNIPDARLLTADCLASGHDVGSVCRYKCNPGFYVTGGLKKKTQRSVFGTVSSFVDRVCSCQGFGGHFY